MNTGGRAACALVAVAVAIGLSGCGGDSEAESPQSTETTTTTTRKLQFEDTNLRDVRMTSGRALGYVQMETASQILCRLLDKERWEELLDGQVGRQPVGPPHAACQIAFSQGLVTVEMNESDDAFEPTTTIAGRPATTTRTGQGYTVALTDDALRPAPRQYYPEKRLLTVYVISDDPDTAADTAEAVLDEIVPLVTEEGDPLPDIDDDGHVRYEETPLTRDFVDQPMPVQALQLCTFVREELDLGVRGVEVHDDATCRVDADDNFTVGLEHTFRDADFPDRLAGRPARISADPASVRVLLRDDAGVALWVTGDDAETIAQELVLELTD